MTREEIGKFADIVIQNTRISADLEKQKPKKPTYDHRYGEMGCAFCGNMVSGWEELPNYCPQCGQALDWSENE